MIAHEFLLEPFLQRLIEFPNARRGVGFLQDRPLLRDHPTQLVCFSVDKNDRRETCQTSLFPFPPSDGLALAQVLTPETGPYQKGETVTTPHNGETGIM